MQNTLIILVLILCLGLLLLLFLFLRNLYKRVIKKVNIEIKKPKLFGFVISLLSILTIAISLKYFTFFIILIHILFIFLLFYLFIILMNKILKKEYLKEKGYSVSLITAFILTAVIISYGLINFKDIKKTEYTVYTDKELSKNYTIGYISDLHFGQGLNLAELENIADEINCNNLDFLILGGDIVDESTPKNQISEVFRILSSIDTRYGIYFTYGNHERYSGNTDLSAILKENSINILYDSKEYINEDICLIGRSDQDNDLNSYERAATKDLIDTADLSKYLILLNHQPNDFYESKTYGINLELCGHTHNGQIFPFNHVIDFSGMYDLTYGRLTDKDFTAIVSSGISGWGCPIRTSGYSEYVLINLMEN